MPCSANAGLWTLDVQSILQVQRTAASLQQEPWDSLAERMKLRPGYSVLDSVRVIRGNGACLEGGLASLVAVEVRFKGADRGGTRIILTGLPDSILRETRARLPAALGQGGVHLPIGELFINLAPATRPKAGGLLDLALALTIAGALGLIAVTELERTLCLGELDLGGGVRPCAGGLYAARAAAAAGLTQVIAPAETAERCAWIAGLKVISVKTLGDALDHLADVRRIKPLRHRHPPTPALSPEGSLDEVRGQAEAKEALALSAAGGHPLLMVGPPGAGKSLLARRLARLLPPLSLPERLDLLARADCEPLNHPSASGPNPIQARPFRAPHHTTSHAGLVGGGREAGAGEVSLSHRGVLFLDELPEFKRDALEALREPMETGRILISRASVRIEHPARFLLVAAMNPCPCGYQGHPRRRCSCGNGAIQRYQNRISGPLFDRLDLVVQLAPSSLDDLAGTTVSGPREAELLERMTLARKMRRMRRQRLANARLGATELDQWVPVRGPLGKLLARAANERALSARAIQSVRRVARTVADLKGCAECKAEHLALALLYRTRDPCLLSQTPMP